MLAEIGSVEIERLETVSLSSMDASGRRDDGGTIMLGGCFRDGGEVSCKLDAKKQGVFDRRKVSR